MGVNASGAGATAGIRVAVVNPPTRVNMDCLFNWAEVTLPDVLYPAKQPSQSNGNSTYRQYMSGMILAIDSMGNVLAQGSIVGQNWATLGRMQDFLPTANAASCGAQTPVSAIAEVLPSRLLREVKASGANSFELTANSFSLSGQKLVNGAGEMTINAAEGNFNVLFDPEKNAVVVNDINQGLIVTSESGPKGSVIRTYTKDGVFLVGYFLENGSDGVKKLWKMIVDGSTEPSNLTNGRTFNTSIQSIAKSFTSRQKSVSAVDGCHSFMNSITESTSEYVSETGDVLDDDEAPSQVRKVGRVAKFLGSIWSKVPALCEDAPEPLSSSDFAKETILEAIKAAGPAGVRKLLDKYSSYKEYLEDTLRKAELLQQAINSLPSNQRGGFGVAIEVTDASHENSLSNNVISSIDSGQSVSQPVTVYVEHTCVDATVVAGGFLFKNNCSYESFVGWCFAAAGSSCAYSSRFDMSSGHNYNLPATPGRVVQLSWWSCPRFVGARTVNLTSVGPGYAYCAYSSR